MNSLEEKLHGLGPSPEHAAVLRLEGRASSSSSNFLLLGRGKLRRASLGS